MDGKVWKASLQNSYAAANIVTDNSVTPNIYRIFDLLPINKNELVGITRQDNVVEVQGIWNLGLSTVPTIVSSTVYQICFGNTGNTQQSYNAPFKPYTAVSPSTLTSDAALDRHNIYSDLATQINADQLANATAYPIVTVVYDTQTVNFTVGATLTDGTTGATGIILADVDAGATGTLTVGQTGDYTLTFDNNDAITDSSGGSALVNGNATVGVALRTIDDAGYYTPNTNRVGPNAMMATKGFSANMAVNSTAGVVSQGAGAFLLADFPLAELTTANLRSGTWEMANDNLALDGHVYSKYIIVDAPQVNVGDLSGANMQPQRIQVLFLDEADADFGATNTALLALNP